MPTRVGDSDALVKPGDRVPGKINRYYEAGQIAPSAIHLTAIKLQEMDQAGLLPESGLDIFSKNGEISEYKLETMDIAAVFRKYGIRGHKEGMPPFAVVGLASVFHNIDHEEIFNYISVGYVDWVSDVHTDEQSAVSLQSEIDRYSDVVDTMDKNMLTAYTRKGDLFSLVILQPFFVYMSVPVVPAIKNVSSGLNVSVVSVLKTLGYMVFDKLRLTNQEKFTEFLGTFGWKARQSVGVTESPRYVVGGAEIGMPSKRGNWMRDKTKVPVSSVATTSPKETFSELFMYYYVHRLYLEAKNAEYVAFMDKFIEFIGDL